MLLRCDRSSPSATLLGLFETSEMFQKERKRRKAKLRNFVKRVYEATGLSEEGFRNTLDILTEGKETMSSSQLKFPTADVGNAFDTGGVARKVDNGGGDGDDRDDNDDDGNTNDCLDASTYKKSLEKLKNNTETVRMIYR